MERKKFKIYWIGITIVVVLIAGISLFLENTMLAISAVVVGMLILFALKSRVKGVIEDERVYKISEKASRRTIQVVGTFTAITGLLIIGLSKSGYLKVVDEIGYSLTSLAAILLMVYMIFYWYYAKKLGE